MHSGPRGSATRWLRNADVTFIFIFIVIIRVIVYISIPYSEFNLTHIIAPHYKRDAFLLFFPCGTKFHTVFSVQDMWQTARRWIKQSSDYRAWIAWTRGPLDPSNTRGINKGVITVVIESCGEHPDCQIAIQRRRSNACL